MRFIKLLVLVPLLLSSCIADHKQKPNFENWYASTTRNFERSSCEEKEYNYSILSEKMKVDGIAKSMSGALSHQFASINSWNEELIWMTGSQLKIREYISESQASPEFLCHSVLNFTDFNSVPWRINTKGSDKRIFTLSQGVHHIEFPEGFGIPMPANASISVGNQVLNLNQPELQTELQFEVDLRYLKDEELCRPIQALYQQPVFITVQTGGPAGHYNQTIIDDSDTLSGILLDTSFASCGISYDDGYHPYQDPFGRTYTGHWIVSPDSIEIRKSNVSAMLDLKYDTKIHYIAVHLHPYAVSLELKDHTTGKSLFKARANHSKSGINLESVDHYSSVEGIPVFKDHEYELISVYKNPEKRIDISAMATMFLYLREQ